MMTAFYAWRYTQKTQSVKASFVQCMSKYAQKQSRVMCPEMCQRESPGADRGLLLPDFPSLGFAPVDDIFRGRVFHAFKDSFKFCHVMPYLLLIP